MILTVTLNSAVDQVLLIEALNLGGSTQVIKSISCVGGKGLDVSVALSGLGVPSTGIAFLAGDRGIKLDGIVRAYGISSEPIWVGGETRICYVLAESFHRRVSHVKVGDIIVHPKHLQDLVLAYRRLLPAAGWVVLAGSIPAGVPTDIYRDLIDIAQSAGIPVLVDCFGEPALKAAQSQPAVLKLNREEFNSTFGFMNIDQSDLYSNADQVRNLYHLEALVITSGHHGILALTSQGDYQVKVPPQQAINAAGAGDAASAALVWRLGLGERWFEALKWAGAVSASAVLTPATGEVDLEIARELFPQVEVQILSNP